MCEWVFDDVQKARKASSDFIQFCTGRAWVFTDTGTTRDGEKPFQFTLRTFLEYFTSCYLVSVHPTPAALLEALQMKIRKGEWDVVAQLSFQIQSKQLHGAADKLLEQLIRTAPPERSEQWNVLSFAERSLEFLVPSPRVRREIVRSALNFWLCDVRQGEDPATNMVSTSDIVSPRHAIEHVGYLLRSTAENRETVADEIKTFLVQIVLSDDKITAASARSKPQS